MCSLERVWLKPTISRALLPEFNFSSALPTLVLRWFGDGGHVGVVAEVFAERTAKNAHAGAVNDAYTRQPGEECAVDETFDFGLGFVSGAADDIDLRGHVIRVIVRSCHGNASAFASGFKRGDHVYC